jgi:hypothetical protein
VLAPWLTQQLLLLARELNPPLVDVAIDEESERSNRSVTEQSTSHRSRILDWLEELSMPRTKNEYGALKGAAAASLGRGGCGA